MEQNKLGPSTSTPWVLDETGIRPAKAGWYMITLEDVAGSDCRAIVSAINNTYGASINPEAVPDLLSALKLLLKQQENPHLVFTGEDPIGTARAAIEKAKLH